MKIVSGLALLILASGFYLPSRTFASGVTIHALVQTSCGDNIKDPSEACDGPDLGGASCIDLGYISGDLACTASCNFDTSACVGASTSTPTTTTSGGGGGGGGGGAIGIPPTGAVFSGRAYPKGKIVLLKDSEIAATATAGDDARFEVSVAGLSGGNYIFSLYALDKDGNRSALATYPLQIAPGSTVGVSGIYITPTIAADKEEVKQGEPIVFFGQTTPQSDVNINVHSPISFNLKTKTGDDGSYLYQIGTTDLDLGDHVAKSFASTAGLTSAYGKAVGFKVGKEDILAKVETVPVKIDLNQDHKVNLVDFSILAYWYKRSNPPAKFDLNGDGKIDVVDFSIMAYYWTG